MKVSFTTLAVLLSATAVHALPAAPPAPRSTIRGDLKDGIETAAKSGIVAIGGILQALPKIIKGAKEAKARKKAWREEQEREEAERREAVEACLNKTHDPLGHPLAVIPELCEKLGEPTQEPEEHKKKKHHKDHKHHQ